jgi:hypothetical protein
VLVIQKKHCKIFEKGYEYSDETTGFDQIIVGFLGIINIRGHNFLACITQKQSIAEIEGANIYIVRAVELYPFYNNFNHTDPGYN